MKPTGIKLIAQERKEQIEKHGRTTIADVENNSDKQLGQGAECLLSKDRYYGLTSEDVHMMCPDGWDSEIWVKMFNKSYKKRLIIAGALIAAELDRVIHIENTDEKGFIS